MNHDLDELAAQNGDRILEKVVRLWTRHRRLPQTSFDRKSLRKSDRDREHALAVLLLKGDELRVRHFPDQQSGERHFHEH